MTRLCFLLVAMGGAVASVFGFDRERMARAWLKRNGFTLREEVAVRDGVTYFQWTVSPPWGLSGTLMKRSRVRENAATLYLERLKYRNFEVVQEFYHPSPFMLKSIKNADVAWDDVTFEGPELSHTVTHRFERPWWV